MGVWYWKAWIGARFTPETSAYWFDWTTLTAGTTFEPDADKTLTAAVTNGAATATMASTTGLRAKGGLWLGPNGSGEGWEYVEYSGVNATQLTGLVREFSDAREHNGVHSIGAAVRQWWPVSGNDGKIDLTWSMNEEMSARDWTAELSGVNVPRFALRNRHIVVITRRTSVTDPWAIWLVGWIDAPEAQEDYRRLAEWKVRVVSVAGVLQKTKSRGIRVGVLDVSKSAQAQTNSQLVMPWKWRHSGDFVDANPTFEPENVLDADMNTLWIAERYVGTDSFEQNDSGLGYLEGGDFATQLRLHNPPNGEKGYRWIEWMGRHSSDDTFWDGYICNSYGWNHLVQFNLTETEFPQRHVICENRERFLEANPHGEDTQSIFEVPSSWWDGLHLDEDAIAIYYVRYQGNVWSKTVAWGTSGSTDRRRPEIYYDGSWRNADLWPGLQIAPPATQQMIRFRYVANAGDPVNQYVVDYVDHAGYRITSTHNVNAISTQPWVLMRLPGMGLVSRDEITDVSPGVAGTLYIEDAGGPATGGLPASGTLQIGDERISYSAKSTYGVTVTARGASGTVAAAHAAGDVIQVVDTDGIATDGVPLTQVGWRRRTGGGYPTKFRIYRSNILSVRLPEDDESYLDDYELIADVTTHASETYTSATLSPARRSRWLLLAIEMMNYDPSRPRINEMLAYLDTSLYIANDWLPANSTVDTILTRLFTNAGVPSDVIDVTKAPATQILQMNTAADMAWAVIADAAAYLGARLNIGLDSRITVVSNTFWTDATLTPVRTWTRANGARLEMFAESGRPANQVALEWESGDGSVTGVERYPGTAYWLGEEAEMGPYVLASSTVAGYSAERRFWMRRYPYRYLVQLQDGDADRVPGDVERLQWAMETGVPDLNRVCVAVSVDSTLEAGVWTTVVGLRQARRDAFDG